MIITKKRSSARAIHCMRHLTALFFLVKLQAGCSYVTFPAAKHPSSLPRKTSGRLFLCYVSGSKASIFMRKALKVRPRDQNAYAFLARREGLTLFDEDDDLLPDLADCLNCHTFSKSSANATENLLAASAYIWPSQSAKSSESVNSRLASSRSPSV